jgi:hypothetical protein
MRRGFARRVLLAGMLAAGLGVSLGAVPASAAGGSCPRGWGSLPEQSAAPTGGHQLTNVRAGRHACFDRLVVDLDAAPATGYAVRYVDEVRTDGSGELVPLRGGARLEVIVRAPDYDEAYQSTYRPANPAELANVAGWQTFRQVAYAGSFEGQTTLGLGVRARLPFRVFTLDGPGAGSRVVLDVAHRW